MLTSDLRSPYIFGMNVTEGHLLLKARLFQVCLERGIRQEQVADAVGIEPSLFSRYLNRRRRPPEDFGPTVKAALDRIEAAERAADETRAKVLAGTR